MTRPLAKLASCAALALTACGTSTATVSPGAEGTDTAGSRVVSPLSIIDFEYDAVGSLTRTERTGAVTAMTYDSLDRPVLSVDPLGGRTSQTHQPSDGLTELVDPRGVPTTWVPDSFSGVTRRTSRDTGETVTAYDEADNLVSSVDARGVTALYQYDALNRLTRVTHHADGGPSEVFTWAYDDEAPADGGSARSAGGLLAAATFPGGASLFEYDALGRLRSQTLQAGGGPLVIGYQYDADSGHVAVVQYPSGRNLELTWAADVPRALTVTAAGSTAIPVVGALSLDTHGTPEQWSWQLDSGGSVLLRRSRDAAGRIARYRVGSAWRALSYDSAGRVASYSHTDGAGAAVPALDETFTYDALDRLVGFSRAGASHGVSYDATGNRTALDGTVWTADSQSNRLVARTSDAGTALYRLDSAGNLLGEGGFTATYDLAGRMASLTRAGVTTTYAYDGSGRRVRKLDSAGTVDLRFIYDTQGHLLGEYAADARAVREYLWVDDTLVAFFQGSELFFVQADHLGAPRVVFDSLGRERWRWLAGPFGEELPEPAPAAGLAAVELPLRFPGQYADSESGLFYNHFRYYEPATGRYIQSDPIGLAGGINTYTYAANDPVALVDPDGLTPTDNWFGHTDPGFQRWWHANKDFGWFSSADEGFNRKKPLDIPNKNAADAMRERYDELKRNGQLDNEERDECRRKRVDRAPRRSRPRGGGGPNGLW